MEYQVRRLEITQGNLEAFVEAWSSGVVPLRESFGFHTHGAWSLPASNEFLWILAYEGPGSFATADAKYYESAERQALLPDPAVYIHRSVEHLAVPVRG